MSKRCGIQFHISKRGMLHITRMFLENKNNPHGEAVLALEAEMCL
jgi:hypothetical protein